MGWLAISSGLPSSRRTSAPGESRVLPSVSPSTKDRPASPPAGVNARLHQRWDSQATPSHTLAHSHTPSHTLTHPHDGAGTGDTNAGGRIPSPSPRGGGLLFPRAREPIYFGPHDAGCTFVATQELGLCWRARDARILHPAARQEPNCGTVEREPTFATMLRG